MVRKTKNGANNVKVVPELGANAKGEQQGGIPVEGNFPVDQWSGSDEFMNAVGILTVRQYDVLEDYVYLRSRIQEIAAAIASEASN